MIKKIMSLKTKQIVILILLFLAILGLNIFIIIESLMNGNASTSQSHQASQVIGDIINVSNSTHFEYIIRKLFGHFGLFGLNGILITIFVVVFSKFIGLKYSNHKILFICLLGLLIAVVSEVCQIGRTGRFFAISDIYIDFLGFVIGVWVISFIYRLTNSDITINM